MYRVVSVKRQDIKKRPLSDTVLDSLEPEDKEYRELDGNGLYFRVQPNGKKAWLFRYKKDNGKWSWLGLGTYPTIKGALARKKAAEFSEKISNGESLTTKNMVKQQNIENENLRFKVLMFDWLDTKKSNWGTDTYDKAVKSIKRHIIPEFGERDFTAISPKEWFDFFQGLQRDLEYIPKLRN